MLNGLGVYTPLSVHAVQSSYSVLPGLCCSTLFVVGVCLCAGRGRRECSKRGSQWSGCVPREWADVGVYCALRIPRLSGISAGAGVGRTPPIRLRPQYLARAKA